MTILVTGAAGFIGFHVTRYLLQAGHEVIGLDNLNNYYDPELKQARLAQLTPYSNFSFYKIDISNRQELAELATIQHKISNIVHLAAQAGVRYSLTNPEAYGDSNLIGHLNMLELARNIPDLQHFVYASSSSVYGANTDLPFSVADRVDQPISLYAATKRSCELMSISYSHLYDIPCTGLRFFTVYGPWGRPDMSAFIFAKAILAGTKIPVFNFGKMRRNFTYIDDILQGVVKTIANPPQRKNSFRHNIYNIGNNKSEKLLDFIETLSKIIGKPADLDLQPLQAGDVPETIADIRASTEDLGFMPTTNIAEGLQQFVEWYVDYYAIAKSKGVDVNVVEH